MKAELLTLTEARSRLRMPKPVFEAVLNSGLLGPRTHSGHLIEESITYYEEYGTQWDTQERFGENGWGMRFLDDGLYENMPPIPGLEGGTPPDTVTHGMVTNVSGGTRESLETDTGWVAQFYLFPNYYMWPNVTELSLLMPPLLKLDSSRKVPGTLYPTRLYPEPSGSLALIVVSSQELPAGDGLERFSAAFDEAYDTVVGVLDYLSVQYDTTLPIAHAALIAVPSGTVHVRHAQRPKSKILQRSDRLLPGPPHPELKAAYALYREAASSNNPFHRFMVFWRVYEEANYVRSQWRNQHKEQKLKNVKVQEEFLPQGLFDFGSDSDDQEKTSFDKYRQELYKEYQVALKHAGSIQDGGRTLTAASADDFRRVATKIAALRYIACVVIRNVEATLDSTATLAGEDSAEENR